MFIFHYKNSRHRLPSWQRDSYNLRTTRGQFNLDTIRKGLKKEGYVIHGHGTHDIHKLLDSVGMKEELIGHLVEVKDPKLAVWFKLNYDNIATDPKYTQYVATYRIFDSEEMENLKQKVEKSFRSRATAKTCYYKIQNTIRSLEGLIDHGYESDIYEDGTGPLISSCHQMMTTNLKRCEQRLRTLDKEYQDLKDEIKNFLQSHKV